MGVALIVHGLFEAIRWLLYARIIISFLPMFMNVNFHHPAIRFILEFTEPLTAPFRRLIPPVGGMDFSILILWLVLGFAESAVLQLIAMMGIA